MDADPRAAALDQLRCYLRSGKGRSIVGPVSAADRKVHYRAFELCVAHELGHTLWEELPPATFDLKGPGLLKRLGTHSGKPCDKGIDSATADLREVSQAKWYEPGSTVCYRAIATFFTLATAVGAQVRTLVSSRDVRLHKLVEDLPTIAHTEISDARIDEICAVALAGAVAPADAVVLDDDFINEVLGLAPTDVVVADVSVDAPLASASALPPLHGWQADAIDLLCESLDNYEGTPVAANITCGAGKSRLILEIIKRAACRAVIFVPAIALLEQFAQEAARWAPGLSVGLVGGGHNNAVGRDIVVCTYHSARELADCEFGLAVVDEAHHVAEEFLSDEGERVRAREILTLCDGVPTLLVSATLTVEDCETAYEYSMDNAICEGTVVDYHIVIPIFTDGNPGAGLRRMIRDHPEWTRVLAYCNTVESAEAFASACSDEDIPARSFCAKTPVVVRKHIMDELEAGDIRVLATVHTLGEGVDIKSADTCMFVEQRNGSIDVTQCLGRVMRRSPGKQIAKVVLPALDEERELVRFMRLLEGADARLRNGGWRSGGRTSFVVDSDDRADASIDASIDAELLAVNAYNRLGELLTDDNAWRAKLDLLRQYVDEHKCLPTQRDEYQGVKLGTWVDTQRQAKKGKGRSLMFPDREAALEAIPGWVWEVDLDAAWQANYDLLRQYFEEFWCMPTFSTEYQGIKLGWWVNTQRQAKKGTSGAIMTPKREAALEAIPGWFWEADHDAVWQARLDLLRQYVDEFGRMPSQLAKYQGVKLGTWVSEQRTGKKGKGRGAIMTPEREAELEAIPGWVWKVDLDAMWHAKLDLLRQYVDEFGRMPSQKGEYQGVKLGSWISEQRLAKKGKSKVVMSPERVAALEAIPGWVWDVDLDATWQTNLGLLQKYIGEFGRLPLQITEYESVRLGRWVNAQRSAKKGGNGVCKMTPEREAALEAIPGWRW